MGVFEELLDLLETLDVKPRKDPILGRYLKLVIGFIDAIGPCQEQVGDVDETALAESARAEEQRRRARKAVASKGDDLVARLQGPAAFLAKVVVWAALPFAFVGFLFVLSGSVIVVLIIGLYSFLGLEIAVAIAVSVPVWLTGVGYRSIFVAGTL